YDALINDLELRKLSRNKLFDVCFNYYNTRLYNGLHDIHVENYELYSCYQIYSLQLVIKDWSESGRLTLCFTYKSEDYADDQIVQMYASIRYLLEQFVASSDRKISDLCLASAAEQEALLYAFNASEACFPRTKTIHQLFEEQVGRTP